MSAHEGEITQRIIELLSLTTESSVDDIRLDSTLRDDLAIDSVETLDMIGYLEQSFGVEISDDDILDLNTVADIVGLVAFKNSCGATT